jgi:hypothetical protein
MGGSTRKVDARKAARRAQASALAAAAERARLNVEDLATFFAARSRADDVDEWFLHQEARLRAEAEHRRCAHRQRGETTKSVAVLAGVSETVVRGFIKEAGAAPEGN